MKNIDNTDRQILRLVQKNGRISNSDLSEKIHLSPSATADRTKRLQNEGYIKNYAAILCPQKLDRSLLVFVEIKLDRTNDDVFMRFNEAVKNSPEVMECHMVAGGFDYLVKARVKDMHAYRQFLAGVLLSLPSIRESHTYPVMEEVKDDNYLQID